MVVVVVVVVIAAAAVVVVVVIVVVIYLVVDNIVALLTLGIKSSVIRQYVLQNHPRIFITAGRISAFRA